jgi:hypothetical protein
MGIKSLKSLQKESIDKELRISLWNAFYVTYISGKNDPDWEHLLSLIWIGFLKQPIDEFEYIHPKRHGLNYLKNIFLNSKWNKIYDFIEFIAKKFPDDDFNSLCNSILERENAAYRLIGKNIVEITSDEEIKEIEETLKACSLLSVKRHITKALTLLSNREHPDYYNSIKESISAVEALLREITGQNSFNDALLEIKKQQKIVIHPALEEAFKKLYGYTSNAGGIRHSFLSSKKSDVFFEEAKFMLVACCAFINYINCKRSK